MRASRLTLGSLLLSLTALLGPRTPAAAEDDSVLLTVAAAVTTNEALTAGAGGVVFKGATPPAFGLDLGLGVPLGGGEIGALVSVVGSGSTPGVGTTQRLSSQGRATVYFRWSYIEIEDFDVFMGLGLGVATTRLSDFIRFELGRDAGVGPEDVTRSFTGLAIDVELGTRIPLADDLRLTAAIAVNASTGEASVAGETFPIMNFPTRFHAGLEWPL